MENRSHKPHKLKLNHKVVLQVTLPLILFAIISLQLTKNVSFKHSTTPSIKSFIDQEQEHPPRRSELRTEMRGLRCDLFSGEWVPNLEGPYYTNESCGVIQMHQNCMKYGRPDNEYMKWRWKPNECELPMFNPYKFLDIVRDKSLAFVGDSVARNHMQSLVCLLYKVERPRDVSYTNDDNLKRWYYPTYNFTLAILWSPYLVKAHDNDPHNKTGKTFYGLYLDEADEAWTAQIDRFEYVIISAGHWFFRPINYYEKRKFMGCRYCEIDNLKEYTLSYGYKNAFRTAFRAILGRGSFKGIVYLRTFAPSHFEGGGWENGGDCLRKMPSKSSEINLEGESLELYTAQMKEFEEALKLGEQRGLRFRLMDMTRLMLMRPDGHPSKYGRPANLNVTWPSDCVHWCLPGPIDSWNDFLLEMLRSEALNS